MPSQTPRTGLYQELVRLDGKSSIYVGRQEQLHREEWKEYLFYLARVRLLMTSLSAVMTAQSLWPLVSGDLMMPPVPRTSSALR